MSPMTLPELRRDADATLRLFSDLRRVPVERKTLQASRTFLGDLRWVARFGLMSQIAASQIEAPIGSLFQKYVSSTFIVKMRIDLD